MKQFTTIALAMLMAVGMQAQDKMHIWIDGKAINYPIERVDSVTFSIAGTENPDEPINPNPDPDPSTAGGIGVFSIAEGKTVCFAKGNLQFNAVQGAHACADGKTRKGTWRFAEHQWDCIGTANENIAETYDGWIDLFGWGTSGYDNTQNDASAIHFQPWESSTVSVSNIVMDSVFDPDKEAIRGNGWSYIYYDASYNTYGYGPSTNMADEGLVGTSANYDWGVFNAISNGGNEVGKWRTLTYREWYYLLAERMNAAYLYSQGTVSGVRGCIFLPDNWKLPTGITWTPTANDYTTNTYTTEQWATMEAMGAVFLPASGCRYGTVVVTVVTVGISGGRYWSASCYSESSARYLIFYADEVNMIYDNRVSGLAVRLVQEL